MINDINKDNLESYSINNKLRGEYMILTYDDFLKGIINKRGQWNKDIRKGRCIRHHIVPRCVGGEPRINTWEHHPNLIWLTPEEHYKAHELLAMENPDNPHLVDSLKHLGTLEDYLNKCDKLFRCMEESPRYGKKHSKETRQKMSEAHSALKNNYSLKHKFLMSINHASSLDSKSNNLTYEEKVQRFIDSHLAKEKKRFRNSLKDEYKIRKHRLDSLYKSAHSQWKGIAYYAQFVDGVNPQELRKKGNNYKKIMKEIKSANVGFNEYANDKFDAYLKENNIDDIVDIKSLII